MKLFFLFFISSIFLWQPKADPVERTAALIKTNSVKELVKTFASNIELTILSEDNVYSREQAEVILNNFFTKDTPTGIKIIHRVDSNPELRFAVCILNTRNGNFRTSFSLRSSNGNYEVTELRIEEEKAR